MSCTESHWDSEDEWSTVSRAKQRGPLPLTFTNRELRQTNTTHTTLTAPGKQTHTTVKYFPPQKNERVCTLTHTAKHRLSFLTHSSTHPFLNYLPEIRCMSNQTTLVNKHKPQQQTTETIHTLLSFTHPAPNPTPVHPRPLRTIPPS